MVFSFYWHDYETFGVDPRSDRPAQFAGLRTDPDLDPVGEPLELWCRLSPDYLPQPEACGLTGIGPASVERLGVREAEFIAAIHEQMAVPGTCTCGYNSIRFDDEVTRCTLYRNLTDPYGREWRNGNSRWDLLDVLRLARTFRPEGLVWPEDPDGTPSFRLERLTAANGIAHGAAHTALADVRATLALARRLKQAQPRLWEFALKARGKEWVRSQVDPGQPQPLIHVSGMFKAIEGSFSLVWPLGEQPKRASEVVLWDLRHPFEPFLGLTVEELRARIYQASGDPERPRLPAKVLHLNRCPIVVRDLRLLTPALAERYQWDPAAARARGEALQADPAFRQRVLRAFQSEGPASGAMTAPADPDFSIYGGFFADADRNWMDRIRRAAPGELAGLRPAFQDPRCAELFFRYRARNWPETLAGPERARWDAHCRARLEAPPVKSLLSRAAFLDQLALCRGRYPEREAMWLELEAYELSTRPCP